MSHRHHIIAVFFVTTCVFCPICFLRAIVAKYVENTAQERQRILCEGVKLDTMFYKVVDLENRK